MGKSHEEGFVDQSSKIEAFKQDRMVGMSSSSLA